MMQCIMYNMHNYRVGHGQILSCRQCLNTANATDDLFFFTDMLDRHSSEIIGLCTMKLSCENTSKLPYFWDIET